MKPSRWMDVNTHTHIEKVLVCLIVGRRECLDNNYIVGAVSMDLSKAFDYISHDLIIVKLAAYDFSSNDLTLILSNLTDRQQ